MSKDNLMVSSQTNIQEGNERKYFLFITQLRSFSTLIPATFSRRFSTVSAKHIHKGRRENTSKVYQCCFSRLDVNFKVTQTLKYIKNLKSIKYVRAIDMKVKPRPNHQGSRKQFVNELGQNR